MTHAPIAAAALALLLPAAAFADGGRAYDPDLHVDPTVEDCSVAFAPELTQGAYRRFAREFGSVSAFKQGGPPITLGRRRVSVSIEDIFFTVEEKSDAWNDTFVHPDAAHPLGADKSFPKLALRVGVTDALDVGASYSENPSANYGWVGVDVRYGLLRQRERAPVSLAARVAYTKTLYVRDMDMHAATIDLSVGRTFWDVLTPYVGAGADAVLARETSAAVDLATERLVVPHATAGVQVRYGHVALGAEAQLSAVNSYQAQLSALF